MPAKTVDWCYWCRPHHGSEYDSRKHTQKHESVDEIITRLLREVSLLQIELAQARIKK